MRISDWSSDVCSSDLVTIEKPVLEPTGALSVETVLSVRHWNEHLFSFRITRPASFRFRSGEFVMIGLQGDNGKPLLRSEEHTSELQSLMRISYAVFCLTKKITKDRHAGKQLTCIKDEVTIVTRTTELSITHT